MALIKKFRTKKDNLEHLIVDSAGSVLPLSRVTGEAVTVNTASVASAEGVVWLNNNDPKQFAAVSGGQYYKDWAEFTYGGITYPPSSIYADKKNKALFRVGNSLMQCTDDNFVYILADDLNQVTEEAHAYADQKVAELVGSAPAELDTLKELADAFQNNAGVVETLNEAIGNKVTKEEGKGLSTNDYTDAEKEKVAGIGAGATIEANFNSANVPYNVVLPFSGSLALAVTISESSAISPNGIFWSAANNKFVARTGTESSYTYHATWPACTIGEESFPASAYYTRADYKGKMYLKGNVSYAFVAGSLVPVGDGVGATIDLSNYYTKTQVDTNFLKDYGHSKIGGYVKIGGTNAISEDNAVTIGSKVTIDEGVTIGKGVTIAEGVKLSIDGNSIKIGDSNHSFIGQKVQIGTVGGNVVIEDNVRIGKNLVFINDGLGQMKMYSGTESDGFAIGFRTILDGDINIGSNVNMANNISIGERVAIESGFKGGNLSIGPSKTTNDTVEIGWDSIGSIFIGADAIIGIDAKIEASFDSTKVPYATVLPFSGTIGGPITVSDTSAISPNGIYWSKNKGRFVAQTGDVFGGYTYHATWPSFTDSDNKIYPASDEYLRADYKGKLYIYANKVYAFVAGNLICVGIGSDAAVTLSGSVFISNSTIEDVGIKGYEDSGFVNIELGSDSSPIQIYKAVKLGSEIGNIVVGDNVQIEGGVLIGENVKLSITKSGTTSYLVIEDPKNNNAIGKIAFVDGDVISTSVVSGDTITV